ncbi:hypothetical protein PsorP6_003110 [Peronosclerospora sorghi]|uniref:Uncharacterized protein n=1 Tax=Peronosclerospora sorghi TaxID=230839 RepID=A0ACC0VNP1_9STRA|nr:hypothetical protein PsorP6_003110 [Peronosclerospora sorghi]
MSESVSEKAAALWVIKTSVSSDDYIAGVGKNQLSDAQLTFWREQKKTPDDVFKILQLKKKVSHDEFVAMVLLLNKYIELTSTKGTSSSKTTDTILFNTLVEGFQDNRRLVSKMHHVQVDKVGEDFLALRKKYINLQRRMKETPWTCPMCTYRNDPLARSQCDMCQSKRRERIVQTSAKASRDASSPSGGDKNDLVESIESSESSDESHPRSWSVRTVHTERSTTLDTWTTRPRRGTLWADAYAPTSMAELCVSPPKVRALVDWLQIHAMPRSTRCRTVHQRVLVVCGPPGAGKSTAVRCIAQHLALRVLEWRDHAAAGKLAWECLLQVDGTPVPPHVSGVDDLVDFVHRASTYPALAMETSRPQASTAGRKRPLPRELDARGAAIDRPPNGQLILLEHWPTIKGHDHALLDEKLERLFQGMVHATSGVQYPIVCIYSDVQGSRVDRERLSRVFSSDVMQSPHTSVIWINAVTSAQLKKQLERVAMHENLATNAAAIQRILDASHGDLRHALNMLQLWYPPSPPRMHAAATTKQARRNIGRKRSSPRLFRARDPFFADLHVIGKLLHGKLLQTTKREAEENQGDGIPSPQEAETEQMLAVSAMPLDRVLGLVHENCSAFFTQVDDLAGALELLSLCDVLLAESYHGVSYSEARRGFSCAWLPLLTCCCRCAAKHSRNVANAILLRAVAITNENPAPKTFRPITRPRTYTVMKRMLTRRDELHVMTSERGDGGYDYVCTRDVFAGEVEPFVQLMDQQAGTVATGKMECEPMETKTERVMDEEIESSEDEWEGSNVRPNQGAAFFCKNEQVR